MITKKELGRESLDIAAEYKRIKEKYKKTTICYYYWRQHCFFTKERCKFAHGIEDLKRYPREELLNIKKSFFILKGKLHGKPNPEGIDPHPKQSRADELDFTSDEEEVEIFTKKRRARTKEEFAKVRSWQQDILVEFSMFLFKELKTNYIRRDLFESMFSDVKLKYDNHFLTEVKKVIAVKTILLSPSVKTRTRVVIKYPVLEAIMDPLADYIANIAELLKNNTFPAYYLEFEKLYHEHLPELLPDIKLLRDLFQVSTNKELINYIQNNEQIMNKIKSHIGAETVKQGFLIDEYIDSIDKDKVVKRFANVWVGDFYCIRNECTKLLSSEFQHFVSKDKSIKSILSSIGYKQIVTGTGVYFVKSSGNSDEFEFMVNEDIDKNCSCKIRSIGEEVKSGSETSDLNNGTAELVEVDESKLKDILIDDKILWVCDFNTLRHAIVITEKVSQIAVDLEGSLSVLFLQT